MGEAGQGDDFVIGRHPLKWRGERAGRPDVEDAFGVEGQQADGIADIGHSLIGIVHHSTPLDSGTPDCRCRDAKQATCHWHVHLL